MRLAALAALLLLGGGARAEPARRPLLLELFTSQGCSSCPPADALLAELAGRRDLLALSMHVTYWNAGGWTDPFSLDAATLRQRGYAASLGQDSVYTPELVVEGRRGVVGSDRAAVSGALAAAAGDAVPGPGLRLERAGSGLDVAIGPGAGHGTVWVVGFDALHRTPVGRGENGGRTLLEADVVRELRNVGPWSGQATRLQVGAPAGEQLAVFVQAADGRILNAARLQP